MKYTTYSKKRSAIVRRAKNIQKKGYLVPWGYLNVPTVKELKQLPEEQQRSIIRTIVSTKVSTVGKKSYKVKLVTDKSGKTKQKHIPYVRKSKKAVKKTTKKVAKPDALSEWGKSFVKSVPKAEKENAKLYVEAVKSGDTSQSFDEWKRSLPSEPKVQKVFNEKLEALQAENPETADWLAGIYNRYAGAEGEEAITIRMESVDGDIPDFEYHYSSGEVPFGKVLKMAQIIKGRPLSGSEVRQLSVAVEKDQG